MTDKTVFFYGTLRDPVLREIVAGTQLAAEPAMAQGHSARRIKGKSFPKLVESTFKSCEGVTIEASAAVLERLVYYEHGYALTPIDVTKDGTQIRALTFESITEDWEACEEWSFESWLNTNAVFARETATEAMRLMRNQTATKTSQFWGQIEMRAATRVRAALEPSPAPLEPTMANANTIAHDTRQPYSEFFAIREDDLSFPRFNGTQSPIVTRACFIGGDAVTVLPWDPQTNNVLLVRQWRHGPFCRGDGNPWTLEPVAGRIDPSETPGETARRELLEETGVSDIGQLHKIAHYYPSPGAYSEFLYNFIAEADLSGVDQRVSGLAGEDEDIMSHVLNLETALEYIASGAVNTGPLIVSLQWLALNREKLANGERSI